MIKIQLQIITTMKRVMSLKLLELLIFNTMNGHKILLLFWIIILQQKVGLKLIVLDFSNYIIYMFLAHNQVGINTTDFAMLTRLSGGSGSTKAYNSIIYSLELLAKNIQ